MEAQTITNPLKRMMFCLFALTLTVPAYGQTSGARDHGEPQREAWQKVAEIFEAMGVRPGAVVADVGAGDGFFTSRLSGAVGVKGRVHAVDIGASVLARLRTRVADENLSNVEVIEGAVDDPKLPAGAIDAILIVNAYHEMTAHQAMLVRMKSALKPDGRLVIIEPMTQARRHSTRDDQTKNHEIGIDFVRQDARDAGFTHLRIQDPFTARPNGHDEEWILVLTPAPHPGVAAAPPSAAEDWKSPQLRITPEEFKKLAANVLILDVRDIESYRQGHLPGALLMTLEELSTAEGTAKLAGETRPIVAYCS